MFDDLIKQNQNVNWPLRDLLLQDIVIEEELHDWTPDGREGKANYDQTPLSQGHDEDDRPLILGHLRQEVKQVRIIQHSDFKLQLYVTGKVFTLVSFAHAQT